MLILEINKIKEWMRDYHFLIVDALEFNNSFVLISNNKWKLVLTRVSGVIWFEVHTAIYEYEFTSIDLKECLEYIRDNVDGNLYFY